MTSQILRNMSWLTLGNVVVKPIWFVFITYVCVRKMGIEQYGSMTATLGLMAILDGAFTLGTTDYTIREVARDTKKSSLYFSNFLPFRMVASILAIAVGLLVELIIGNQDLLQMAFFAGTYVLFRNLTNYCRTLFRANEIFKYEAFSTIWEKVFVVLLGWIFLYRVPTASSALLGMSLGMAITFVLNYRWVMNRFATMARDLIHQSFFKQALPKAIPLGLASIFVLLYLRTDSVMIEAFKGELPTGQYAIAFRVVEALGMLPAMASAVLLPRLSDTFGTAFRQFRSIGLRSVFLIFGASILIAVAIALIAPFVVTTIDPSDAARPAIPLMRILIWVFPLASVNSVLATMMVASNRQRTLALTLGLAAIVNIALNLTLIPEFSATGASYATIATQLFVAVAFLSLLPKAPASKI